MTWLVCWAVGFAVLTALALAKNLSTVNTDDHWPPGCVVLFAIWPLWLVGWVLQELAELIREASR